MTTGHQLTAEQQKNRRSNGEFGSFQHDEPNAVDVGQSLPALHHMTDSQWDAFQYQFKRFSPRARDIHEMTDHVVHNIVRAIHLGLKDSVYYTPAEDNDGVGELQWQNLNTGDWHHIQCLPNNLMSDPRRTGEAAVRDCADHIFGIIRATPTDDTEQAIEPAPHPYDDESPVDFGARRMDWVFQNTQLDFEVDDDEETKATNLMTDFRHWCDQNKVDFNIVLRKSQEIAGNDRYYNPF